MIQHWEFWEHKYILKHSLFLKILGSSGNYNKAITQIKCEQDT